MFGVSLILQEYIIITENKYRKRKTMRKLSVVYLMQRKTL